MTKPILNTFSTIAPLLIQQYERSLPTAFDESLTLLQKMNMIIKKLDEIGTLSNDLVTQWNVVMEWVMGDGLSEAVSDKLDEMVTDGTLDEIINVLLFGELNEKIDKVRLLVVDITNPPANLTPAVGDGVTDDTASIQAIINYVANRGGGIIGIPFSSQPFIFTQLLVKSHIILKGFGGTLKLKAGVCMDANASYYPINNMGYHHTTFDSLIVDGNGVNNPLFTVADLITCVGEGSQVINCDLSNSPDSGIMFSDAKNGRCQNNRITNCPDVGIYVNGSTKDGISGAVISGNVIDYCVYGGIALKRQTSNIVVSGNNITKCGNGITVEDFTAQGQGYPTDCQIVSNSLRDIGLVYRGKSNLAERGISISKADNLIVSDNKVINCSGVVLNIGEIINSVISGNLLDGDTSNPQPDGQSGIYVVSMDDTHITDNIIKDVKDYGIYLATTNRGTVRGNSLTCVGTQVGLRVNASCVDTFITENHVKGGSSGDTSLLAGHTCIVRNNNLRSATAGTLGRLGYRVISAGQPLPNVSYVAYYPGEIVQHLVDGGFWMAKSTTAGDWSKLSN